MPDRYDPAIRAAAVRWWRAGPEWQWLKAQLWQESRLDPAAVSPVGARGIAQFMPGTWVEVSGQLGYVDVSPVTPTPAINAAAYYMLRQQAAWASPRPQLERHYLALASYNAGLGNILAAQRACGGALLWRDIEPCLPAITGRHAAETQGYVRLIRRWREEMK